MGRLRFLAVLIVVAIVTASVSIIVLIPWTPDDAHLHAEERIGASSGTWTWSCPLESGGARSCTLEMEIAEEDLDRSFSESVLRQGALLVPSPVALIDPGCDAVRAVADHVSAVTEGASEELRARAALAFVQSAIRYADDEDLWGCSEFWAAPTETLWAHRGDCEDTAVLLCSVYAAMGIRCVLLDYPGHVAVYLGDSEDYLFCETTGSGAVLGDGAWRWADTEAGVHEVGEDLGVKGSVNAAIAWYRGMLHRATGA